MVEVVRVPGWERFGWLRQGFSTRSGGVSTVYGGEDLNLGLTKDDDAESVRENRRRFVEAVTGAGLPMVAVRQVHGIVVQKVSRPEEGGVDADGLVTAVPKLALGIQVADCVPVLLADTRLRVVSALHAGWRGTVAGIVERGIALMQRDFGSKPEDLIGAVGPSIGSCCYAVGDEVRGSFDGAFGYAADLFEERGGEMFLDLAEANRRQMVAAGLKEDAVAILGECTGCGRFEDGSRKYFSHRIEHGVTGRAMGVIAVAGE